MDPQPFPAHLTTLCHYESLLVSGMSSAEYQWAQDRPSPHPTHRVRRALTTNHPQNSPPSGNQWAIHSNHHCSRPLRLFSSPGISPTPHLKGILRVADMSGFSLVPLPPLGFCVPPHQPLCRSPDGFRFLSPQAFANVVSSIWTSLLQFFIWETKFCLWSSAQLVFCRERCLVT